MDNLRPSRYANSAVRATAPPTTPWDASNETFLADPPGPRAAAFRRWRRREKAGQPGSGQAYRRGPGDPPRGPGVRRPQRSPLAVPREGRPLVPEDRPAPAAEEPAHRHPAAAPGRRRRPVLVGVCAMRDAAQGDGRPRDARPDRRHSSHGQDLSRRVRDGVHGRRRRPHPQGRQDRVADRRRGGPFHRQLAGRAAALLRARRPLHDADALGDARLGRLGDR